MDILTRINWVDVLALIIVLRISYVALGEGLSHEIFPLLGSILMVILSLHYYNTIGIFVYQNVIKMPLAIANFLGFLGLTVAAGFILKLLKFILDKIIKIQWHPLIEKVGGLVAGVARAGITVSIILMMLMLVPLPYLQRSIRDRSITGIYFLKIGPEVYAKTGLAYAAKEEIMKDLISDKRLDVKSEKNESKKTPVGGEKAMRINGRRP